MGALRRGDGTLQECIRPALSSRSASCNALSPANEGLQALLRRLRGIDRDDFLVGVALLLQLCLTVAPLRLSVSPPSRSILLVCFLIAPVRLRIIRQVSITASSTTITHGGFPVRASSFAIAASRLRLGVISCAHRASQAPGVAFSRGICSVPPGVLRVLTHSAPASAAA
jgi:hypothetical protein